MQKAYNKLDIVVCTHFNMIANMNHIEIRAICYIDTISS